MHIQTIQIHFKKTIPYSHAFHTNRISKALCSTETKIIERGYKENILKDQINKADKTDRKDLLRKKEKRNKDRIPFIITYNRKLPMMRKIISKH